MACTDWQDSGGHRLHSAENDTAADWRSAGHGDRSLGWNGAGYSEPGSAASQTPATPVGTPKATAPKPKAKTKAKPAAKAAKPSSTPKPAASAAATPTSPPSPSTPKASAPASGTSARIVQLVNAERGKVGCSPVTLNAVLTKAAQAHSADMAAHQNMSHTGSDGSSPGDRITRAGYVWSTYGENVAYGYSTPEQVMAGWMSSPGHKANILNCAFKEIGVGLAQSGSYWTQDFATAR
ncbi:CAP domain-containing protein [Streptomyces rishiriensis]|uniref:CAP domain-containing protein n=1 Tax=Streptomyces rishiriensis TaxID=68264 RepID=UPI00358EDCD7